MVIRALSVVLLSGSAAFAGTGECVYDNLDPDIAAASVPSQFDPVQSGDPVFFAEGADDFVLDGTPGNPCVLESVSFAVRFFNTPPGAPPVTPAACWTGVVITIYEDIAAGRPPFGDPLCDIDKGPAGFPLDNALPDLEHFECFPGAVVCEITTDMSQVTSTMIDADSFEVTVSGLDGCALEKDRKYWIAIAPMQNFFVCGQVGLMRSTQSLDHPAMHFFAQMQIAPWTSVGGDLALRITASRPFPPYCPADTDGDLDVDVDDLNNVILDWGSDGSAHGGDVTDASGTGPPDGVVNVNDLNAVVVGWGDCPTPPNDDCFTAEPVVVPVDPASPSFEIPLDMRGATPGSITPVSSCVGAAPDVWFSFDYTGNNAGVYVIFTEPDVFVEVFDGCVCHPGALNLLACGDGATGVFVSVAPGQLPRCVRLVNPGGIPNDQLVGVITVDVNAPPDNDACQRRVPIGDGVYAFDTGLASIDPADPAFSCGGPLAPARDIWFNYTAAFDGFLFLDTSGSSFDTLLEVYDGVACPPTTSLACDDNGGDGNASALTLPITAGQTLKLRVGGNESGGPGTLDVQSVESFAPPCTGSTWSQRPHEPAEPTGAQTSDTQGGFTVFDDFPWDGGDVTSVWFYGFDAFFAGSFQECDEPAPTFDVLFHADDGGQPGVLLASFLATPAIEKNATGVYDFAGVSFQGWQYKVTFPAQALPAASTLWIAIRGATTGDGCWFLWVTSPEGVGDALQLDGGGVFTPIGNRAFCVNRE